MAYEWTDVSAALGSNDEWGSILMVQVGDRTYACMIEDSSLSDEALQQGEWSSVDASLSEACDIYDQSLDDEIGEESGDDTGGTSDEDQTQGLELNSGVMSQMADTVDAGDDMAELMPEVIDLINNGSTDSDAINAVASDVANEETDDDTEFIEIRDEVAGLLNSALRWYRQHI